MKKYVDFGYAQSSTPFGAAHGNVVRPVRRRNPCCGADPVPVLKDAQIRAGIGFDATTGRYTYTYTINNPANQDNTGKIWSMSLDTTHMGDVRWMDSAGLTLPKGFTTKTFDEQLDAAQPLDLPFGTTVIPFGLQVPAD